jgi:hypothetical protein
MITFYQQINEIIKSYSVKDPEQIVSLKRWYNVAYAKVKKKLMRATNAEPIYTNLVAGQSIYQLPSFAGRVYAGKYNKTDNTYPLNPVASERLWEQLKSGGTSSGTPTEFRVISDNEIELWPAPSQNIVNGLELTVAIKAPRLTADDVTTGTATANINSQTVTLTSGVVTPQFVGRYFTVNDGHEDWYRISEYVSSTSFKLENYFTGNGGASLNYIVGEMIDIPEEYIDLPNVYVRGMYTEVYRKNRVLGMQQEFEKGIESLNEDYANPTKSRVVKHRANLGQNDWPYSTPWVFNDNRIG